MKDYCIKYGAILSPWNKGLRKDDSRIQNILEKRRQTMLSRYGKLTVNTGNRVFSEETRQKMSESAKRRWQRERDIIIKAQNEGKTKSDNFKKAMSNNGKKTLKRLWSNPEFRKRFETEIHPKMVEGWKNSSRWLATIKSKEYKEKISKCSKQIWRNPKIKAKIVRAVLNGIAQQPNKAERRVGEILEEILPGEYQYVGDGKVIIGGCCPDFINVKGKKKVIEVFGRVFHDPNVSFREKIPFYQTEEGRRLFFRKYDFDTLIIWDDELENLESLKRKILEFNNILAFLIVR